MANFDIAAAPPARESSVLPICLKVFSKALGSKVSPDTFTLFRDRTDGIVIAGLRTVTCGGAQGMDIPHGHNVADAVVAVADYGLGLDQLAGAEGIWHANRDFIRTQVSILAYAHSLGRLSLKNVKSRLVQKRWDIDADILYEYIIQFAVFDQADVAAIKASAAADTWLNYRICASSTPALFSKVSSATTALACFTDPTKALIHAADRDRTDLAASQAIPQKAILYVACALKAGKCYPEGWNSGNKALSEAPAQEVVWLTKVFARYYDASKANVPDDADVAALVGLMAVVQT